MKHLLIPSLFVAAFCAFVPNAQAGHRHHHDSDYSRSRYNTCEHSSWRHSRERYEYRERPTYYYSYPSHHAYYEDRCETRYRSHRRSESLLSFFLGL